MRAANYQFLFCPVTRTALRLQVISTASKNFDGIGEEIVNDAILFAADDWFYPVIGGIPRLLVEAFIDYEAFFRQHLPDYADRRKRLEKKNAGLIQFVITKNARTKRSFTKEWSIFNYAQDKTWDAGREQMFERFLAETNETAESLAGKFVFDAGCGNGLLNQLIAAAGAVILGMDLSRSVERAFRENVHSNAMFIQGDVQFPPLSFEQFDLVHCSGVLIHTNNSELSFSCIEPCVKPGGKLSVWLYHPRKNRIHKLFNSIRRFTSKLPLRLQYWLYLFTLFPASYCIKRFKGNKQSSREMMIDILDWFSPEFRREHHPHEVVAWFSKRNYHSVKQTTQSMFGFNMTGIKKMR